MKKHIETIETGLKCDNKSCNYEDKTIKSEDYEKWINQPCPKCGENLLTEEDYNNVRTLEEYVNLVNTMTDEQITEYLKMMGHDEDEIKSDKKITVEVNTHKGIKFNKTL